jgi:hypothetical protein
MAPSQKRGTFLKSDAPEPDPVGLVPVVIRRLKLPVLPAGSLFAWMYDRLDKQRCQVAESRRRLAEKRARKASTMRRYRAKIREARPDLKAIWRKRG